ncbi:MAG TPA: FISUMP domain-containing protein [Flavobacteriales bacterium]|nr:FISUMP domain-containing protein [Flavobacteriales bacterium]
MEATAKIFCKNSIQLTILHLAILLALDVQAQFTCGDSLLDTRDGQRYATVLIGSDCWFKQNLNYGTMVISDSSGTIHSDMANNGIPEKYAQENNAANLSIYGGLYEGAELMDYIAVSGGQGLCPPGWHVSTDEDWQNLIATAGAFMTTSSGGNGGNKLKKVGEGIGTGAGTDNVGFAALHGGDRDGYGIFYGKTLRAIFWTSTIVPVNKAYHYTLWAENDTIERLQLGLVTTGFSCRCVENTGSGTNEPLKNSDVTIFPNPASEFVRINLNTIATPVNYTLYNSIGLVVSTGLMDKHNYNIELTTIVSGYYLLSLDVNGQKIDKKIIVVK